MSLKQSSSFLCASISDNLITAVRVFSCSQLDLTANYYPVGYRYTICWLMSMALDCYNYLLEIVKDIDLATVLDDCHRVSLGRVPYRCRFYRHISRSRRTPDTKPYSRRIEIEQGSNWPVVGEKARKSRTERVLPRISQASFRRLS